MMRLRKSYVWGFALFVGLFLFLLVHHLDVSLGNFIPHRMEITMTSSHQDHKHKMLPSHAGIDIPRKFSSLSLSSSSSSKLSSSSSSDSGKRQLLLITKGRSGSSFTSALVNNDDQVFYSFEPLYYLVKMIQKGTKDTEVLKQKAYSLLRGFIECDFSDVTGPEIAVNNQLRLSGQAVQQFYKCIRSQSSGWKHLDCLHNLVGECRRKTVTFAKILRFSISWAEPLFQPLPNLKILYLIRDPRAVLNSQSRVFSTFKWPEEAETAGQKLCQDIENDLRQIERLNAVYPGRIHVIKYEKGATEPMEYAKDIYKFAGLNFTQQTAAFIESLSTPTRRGEAIAYSLHRSNATKTMNSWRHRVGFEPVQKIDKACAVVYKQMGYKPALSETDLVSERDLVDLNVPMDNIRILKGSK